MGKVAARKSFRRKTGKAGDDCTEQSAARKDGAKKQRRSIPLWYLPGVLHALILLLAALVICLLVQNPLLELLAAVTATGGSLTGFILTWLGVRMFDLKSRLTWYIER